MHNVMSLGAHAHPEPTFAICPLDMDLLTSLLFLQSSVEMSLSTVLLGLELTLVCC